MSDVWNSVTVYGPAADIERFKRSCIDPEETIYTSGQRGWDGCGCDISVPASAGSQDPAGVTTDYSEYVVNFQQFTPSSEVEYSFTFDTLNRFPVELFERLAERFPNLSFDCDCIEASDEFMGFGWFNPPLGGEEFRQDYRVPKDYWTGGGGRKRSDAAEIAHGAHIGGLRAAAEASLSVPNTSSTASEARAPSHGRE